jgi:ABC-type transport system involved in cytochrome c biogenesis permease subunit
MASTTIPDTQHTPSGAGSLFDARSAAWDTVCTALKPFASLKLTVVLFACSIAIVLTGTLAQVHHDIWDVVDQYFRVNPADLARDGFPWFNPGALFVWIDSQLFFPASFFPSKPDLPDWLGIWFPKGWVIGAVMMLNLFSAHLVRFKVQAGGTRLWAGWGVIALGCIVTALVILGGNDSEGFQHESLISWDALWGLLQVGLLALAAAAVYGGVTLPRQQSVQRWGLLGTALVLASILAWTFIKGEQAQLDDSYMRILYQLIKGTLAGLVLLAGCVMVFRKRGGIVLLHGGIGLMMFSELLVGLSAVEAQMAIPEGETRSYVVDNRSAELAIVDPSNEETDRVTVVPASLLASEGTRLADDALPFDIEVVAFYRNSVVPEDERPGADNLATRGSGLRHVAHEARPGVGTDTESQVDAPSAYLKLTDKSSGEDLGVWLVNVGLLPQSVTAGGKDYEIALRFTRTYKPYQITLVDFRKDDYIGTNTPRNYSSDIRLVDGKHGVDRELRIWMNNPLRYAGETFYQSSFIADPRTGEQTTVLQVVTNSGWMIPYVSCMIVAVALLAQFGAALLRFLQRRQTQSAANISDRFAATEGSANERTTSINSREAAAPGTKPNGKKPRAGTDLPDNPVSWDLALIAKFFPLVIVLLFAFYVAGKARMPSARTDAMDLAAFGKIPIVYEGRPKPIDSLARNSLLVISDRQEFTDSRDETQPAVRWLLDVITNSEAAAQHRVFRIENLDVLETLGLERRKGFRYALGEFIDKLPEFDRQLQDARKVARASKHDLTFYQRKLIDLAGKLEAYQKLQMAFIPPGIPPLPDEAELEQNRDAALAQARTAIQAAMRESQRLEAEGLPLAIPVEQEQTDDSAPTGKWLPFSSALLRAYLQSRLMGEEAPEPTRKLNAVLLAYREGDVKAFNSAVDDYQRLIAGQSPRGVDLAKVRFESFFNHFSPFYYSAALYVAAFVLVCLSWLGWSEPLRRASFWLIAFTLLVHTWALWARINISGRPPVTNLYSSAVFIGWACVLLGLVLEWIYRLGMGNVIAAVAGFITLGIAHFLAGDGDTFTVLQAVLDTQFWLATHVVCITLGYATTYVAGLLGLIYIIRGVMTPSLTPSIARDLTRMTYGALCFAIFFSFVGTVLGGLWADDSWGRFWGWDPKENGALIIVLWNALVLHARWDGMVKERGLAVLAVIGNIAVSWSWFGVNELGVGLHSYGFTEGVLMALGVFCLTQLLVVAAGCLPRDLWWSHRRRGAAETPA